MYVRISVSLGGGKTEGTMLHAKKKEYRWTRSQIWWLVPLLKALSRRINTPTSFSVVCGVARSIKSAKVECYQGSHFCLCGMVKEQRAGETEARQEGQRRFESEYTWYQYQKALIAAGCISNMIKTHVSTTLWQLISLQWGRAGTVGVLDQAKAQRSLSLEG